MKIRDLFQDKSEQLSSQGARPEKTQAHETTESAANQDRVSISKTARQYAQISRLLTEDEQQQQQRVAELKSQVDGGTYNVSSKSIAQAIVSRNRD